MMVVSGEGKVLGSGGCWVSWWKVWGLGSSSGGCVGGGKKVVSDAAVHYFVDADVVDGAEPRGGDRTISNQVPDHESLLGKCGVRVREQLTTSSSSPNSYFHSRETTK